LRPAGWIAALISLAAACHKPAEFVYVDELQESWTQAGSLPAGAVLGVYVLDEEGNVSFRKTVADKDGNAILPAPEGGTVIACTPCLDDWDADAVQNNPIFSVKSDQGTLENYLASDLMMGMSTPSSRKDGQAMTLSHMLCKVVVNIIDDIGCSDLSQTRVDLLSMYNSVTVDFLGQKVNTVEIKRGDIRMFSVEASDWRLTSFAIVAPHEMEAGSPFFSVALFGDNPLTFTIPEGASLEGGSTFTLSMRITQQGLIPDGWSITDWENEDEHEIVVIG